MRRVASSIGYTAPVMWYGPLADSGVLTPDQILAFAKKWFLPQHIVIGRANHAGVTKAFYRLAALVNSRGLVTVTLNDVFKK